MEAARPKPKVKKRVSKKPKSSAQDKIVTEQESSTAEKVEGGIQEASESPRTNTSNTSSSPTSREKSQFKGHSAVKENDKLVTKSKITELDSNTASQSESNKVNSGDSAKGDQVITPAGRSGEENSRNHSNSDVNCVTVASDKNVEKNSGTSEGKKSSLKLEEVKKVNINKEDSIGSKPPSLKDIGNVSEGENSLDLVTGTLSLATPSSTPRQGEVRNVDINAGLCVEGGVASMQTEQPDSTQHLSVNNLTKPSAPLQTTISVEAQTTATFFVMTDSVVESSAPPLIDLDTEPVATQSAEATASRVAPTLEKVVYPKLDIKWDEEAAQDDLEPYSENDLAYFSPNPQLDNYELFTDSFIQSVSNMNSETHELYDLLMTYLKTKRALTHCLNHMKDLRKSYKNSNDLTWQFENKEASSTGRCGDGSKVAHTFPYRVAVFYMDHLLKTTATLKEIRQLLDEEMCIKWYYSQLARVHVEQHLYLLMRSVQGLRDLSPTSSVTSYIPFCPPGCLDSYCSRLRDSISVLFHFERQPVVDEDFTTDCRKWLTQLSSVLMRVSSLSEHQFLFNHLLRCPAGVGHWGAELLQITPPSSTKDLLQEQLQTRGDSNYSHDWRVGLGLHGDWGGPVLDHFMTMLATLMLPIKEREKFLASLNGSTVDGSPALKRNASVPWAFIDETDEDSRNGSSDHFMSESDYIFFFNQFPFNDMFAYILQFTGEEEYSLSRVTSHQMLRLIAFCTCLVRLLGAAFSTLRLARYKEFSKQVGQTIRNTVAFVSDHWSAYRAYRILRGDDLASLPTELQGSEYKHSLNRLQVEFDQFVLRSIKWILTAQKLGAWQFLADMPYGSISLGTIWNIFWNIYCKNSLNKEVSPAVGATGEDGTHPGNMDTQRPFSPSTIADIQEALKAGTHKDQFVDSLMKTYTSEAEFLLTTLVNMVRARSCDSHNGSCDPKAEQTFINTITLEIFECTQVVEYARETYFKTGSNLLDSIAAVHPFVISTLLGRVETAIGAVGENCIQLFQRLSLHLWVPRPRDVDQIHGWLLEYPLNSSENTLARNILAGLNWGTKAKAGSFDLVLPWHVHCSTALCLVNALSRHLPHHPGGRDFTPGSVSKYTTRLTTSQSQVEFEKWAWEVALMLKLHPHQVTSHVGQTLCPSTPSETTVGGATGTNTQSRVAGGRDRSGTVVNGSCLDPPAWIHVDAASGELILPNLEYAATTVAVPELMELKEAAKNEGLLAYYVILSITDTGTDTDHFIAYGLSKLQHLVDEGYYKATLKLLANTLPKFFKHTKILLQDSMFLSVLLSLANADSDGASMKEKWITGCVSKVTKMLSALIQTQLDEASTPGFVGGGGGSGGGETVLKFWLEVLLSCPTWHKESNILYLLNNLCMAAFFNNKWAAIIQEKLVESYQALCPLQPKKSLVSSVYSSVASMVWQDGGTPSLFNVIPHQEYPWLGYRALCAEQEFQEEEKIWKELLCQLRRDDRILLDTALKRAFSELKTPGSFPSSHLCLYRWAQFCNTLDSMHPMAPLVWQRFFTLYLARAPTSTGEVGKEGYGHRFFSSSHSHGQLRELKCTLLNHCRKLQAYIASLETPDWADKVGAENSSDSNRDTLRHFYPKCRKFYQTLSLWLQEPRLHTPNLYLPGLPASYDSARLASIFQGSKAPWVEFIPDWDLKAQLNALVKEWMQLAAYQKSLPFEPQPSQPKQSTAASRIHSRLQGAPPPKAPPAFQYCHPPFSPLADNVLLSKDALLQEVDKDMQLLLQQAKSFSSSTVLLTVYDDDYVSAMPELYTNDPRQFHVRVPCRKMFSRNHQCSNPATVVFRFNEATLSSSWDGQLKDNRKEWDQAVEVLSAPLNVDLVQRLVRLEHTVAELSRMAMQNKEGLNVPLQIGVELFFRVLGYYRVETRKYPPSKQFLSSCISILGQTFVQQDRKQAINLLNQLLIDCDNADILAPLIQPNLCHEDFVKMYESTVLLTEKHGPSVAFSVLTKFNILLWLETYNNSYRESESLLAAVAKGLNLFGPKFEGPAEALVDIFRQHFVILLNHDFPKSYQSCLQIVLNGTEAHTLAVEVWEDFRKCLVSEDPSASGGCHVGMQQLELSLHSFTSKFGGLRHHQQSSIYSLVERDYVKSIGLFLRQLCFSLVNRICSDIAMDTTKLESGVSMCWHSIVGVFEVWLFLFQQDSSQDSVLPCTEEECVELKDMMEMFVDAVAYAHDKFHALDPSSPILTLMWTHYSTFMTHPLLTHFILDIYHTILERLPWKHFYPSLGVLESMMKLKVDRQVPSQCFVFLGTIFPRLDWPSIMRECEYVDGEDAAIQFHIMVLQLLVMLISEKAIMQRDDTNMPEMVLHAQKFSWRLIDAKMYQDVMAWQTQHCTSSNILHKGSSLSLSLRLLKSAAGFPSTTAPCPAHQINADTWEKRFILIHAMVELISDASHRKDAQQNDYVDCMSSLMQIAVDISIQEPDERFSPCMISLLQEILSLLNISSEQHKAPESILKVLLYLFQQLPNVSILSLPCITAACQSVASLALMVQLVEQVMFGHFQALPAPPTEPLQLVHDPSLYGWKSVVDFLVICEDVREGLMQAAIDHCSVLILHAVVLRDLLQCTSMEQELQLIPSIIAMCSKLKPKPSEEVKLLLLWMKMIDLTLRQLQYVPNCIPLVLPHLTSMATMFTKFGEDRAREGLLSKIGLGKKSEYAPKFRLLSRSLGVFLQCQMPVDMSGAIQLRLVPNAPGHVKEDSRRNNPTPSTPFYSITPTKQNEQALQSLEALQTAKEYSSLTESVNVAVNFVTSPAHSIPSCAQLLRLLTASLYPEYRFLDLLRT